MASPLSRRVPRELRGNLGKYAGIFALLVVAIAFGVGFLSSIESLQALNEEIPERYALEDGRFTTAFEAGDEVLDAVRDLGVSVYENFSRDVTLEGGIQGETTVRVHAVRTEVDLAYYFEGRTPEAADEIALNRNWCEANGVAVGDVVEVAGTPLTVCGILTLPDYISLFQKNTDLMFNAVTFCVAEMSAEGYASLSSGQEAFTYSFVFDDEDLSVSQKADLEEDMASALAENGAVLSDFIDADENQGITYASEDQEGDAAMMLALVMLVVVVVAFVFAVLASGTIADESAIIGTLLASGYRKREILLHYLSAPALVGLAGAVVGNAVGYGFMVDFVLGIYTGNYSYPPVEALFSLRAFLLTTVVPCALLVGIMALLLAWKMRLAPLQFLRRELSHGKTRAGVRLPASLGFAARFRLRAILRNGPNYLVLGIGVLFANVLFLFGAGLLPSIQSYADLTLENAPAAHQYVLKAPVELEGDAEAVAQAEKFALCELEATRPIDHEAESVSVHGIQEDSSYYDIDVSDSTVVVGLGFSQKFGFAEGDTFTLRDKYEDVEYSFTVGGVCNNSADTGVYMSLATFNETFGNDEGSFSGYLSDEELAIDEEWLASDIDEDALTGYVDQMTSGMGDLMVLFNVFAVMIYFVLMYLLTKTVVERSARHISSLKVFGYTDREVSDLYVRSITIAVMVFLALTLPLACLVAAAYCNTIFATYTGNITMKWPVSAYVGALVAGVACYAVVAFLHVRRIKRVPLALAVKVQE